MNGCEVRGGVTDDYPQTVFGENGKVYSNNGYKKYIQLADCVFKSVSLSQQFVYQGIRKIIAGQLDCGLSAQYLLNIGALQGNYLQSAYPYQIDGYIFILPRPKNNPMYLNIFMVFTI